MKPALKNLIAKGKVEKAIQLLLEMAPSFQNQDLHNEVLMQAARYESYKKEKRLNTKSAKDLSIELASLNQALLELISQLPDSSEPEIPTSKPKAKSGWWKSILASATIIGILAGVAEVTGYSLRDWFSTSSTSAYQLTVYVHGSKGRQDIVLERKDKIIADFDNRKRETRNIGEEGRTNFEEIDARFLDQPLSLNIQSLDYELTFPDSIYTFTGEPIYLEIKTACRFCTIQGIVQDNNNKFVSEAVVMLKGLSLSDTTNQQGLFHIQVPPEQEKEEYTLVVLLDNKIVWEKYVTPSPNSPLEILLEQ